MYKSLMIAAVLTVSTLPVQAAVIERACLKSDRPGASRSLCGCIQKAADATLSRGDQRLARKFFKDPDFAQEIRQSDRSSHEAFWKRYKVFNSTAQKYCRRG